MKLFVLRNFEGKIVRNASTERWHFLLIGKKCVYVFVAYIVLSQILFKGKVPKGWAKINAIQCKWALIMKIADSISCNRLLGNKVSIFWDQYKILKKSSIKIWRERSHLQSSNLNGRFLQNIVLISKYIDFTTDSDKQRARSILLKNESTLKCHAMKALHPLWKIPWISMKF